MLGATSLGERQALFCARREAHASSKYGSSPRDQKADSVVIAPFETGSGAFHSVALRPTKTDYSTIHVDFVMRLRKIAPSR